MLACGRGAEIVSELERLVAEEPLRERPLRLLMLALYRSGRQAAALDAYRTAQVRLADELGLDPGPQLRELEHQILTQDPALDVPRAAGVVSPPVHATTAGAGSWLPGWRWCSRRARAIALVVTRGGNDPSRAAAASTQIVSLNSDSGALAAAIVVPGAPAAIAARAGSLWLADPNAGSIVHVDASSQAIVGRVAVGGSPGALAIGGGFVWAASVPGDEVARIDPRTETRTQTIPLGGVRVTGARLRPRRALDRRRDRQQPDRARPGDGRHPEDGQTPPQSFRAGNRQEDGLGRRLRVELDRRGRRAFR